MALIVAFHTVATQLATTATDITEGMGVELVAVTGGSKVQRKATSSNHTFGIAGDSAKSTGPNKPYGASLVVNSAGGTRATQNRVSDFFNETVGSGKITVYSGIGEFYTDQYVSETFVAGAALYSATASGKMTQTSGSNGNKIGTVIAPAAAYPSGIPGVDDFGVSGVTSAVDGSLSLGTFLRFSLMVTPGVA